MMIIYGWGDVARKDMAIGVTPCDACNEFTMHYLTRRVFRVHICYLPIFKKTKGYYIMCNKCTITQELQKSDYKILKETFKPFHKKKLLNECFAYINALTDNQPYNQEVVQSVFNQVRQYYPISDGVIKDQYVYLIDALLRSKQQVITNNQTEVLQ